MPLSPKWGPFDGPHQASTKLAKYVDESLDPSVGIAWSSLGELTPLRRPQYDSGGFGDVLVFGWDLIPPPSPPRPDAWGKFLDYMESALADIGQSQLDQANAQLEADRAIGHAVSGVFSRMADPKNRMDGAGVALDVLCVGLSLAAMATPVGWIGLAAFAGSVALLAADGGAYGAELAGDDTLANGIKDQTQLLRVCATILTLPDIAWGGLKAVQEINEVRALRASSLSTAARADADAMRSVSRGKAFASIADRARQRAAARMVKLRWMMAHEITPRAIAPGGIYLLIDELTDKENKGAVAQFLRQYSFHVVAHHQS